MISSPEIGWISSPKLGCFYSIGYGLGSAVMEVRVFCGWNLEVGCPQGRNLEGLKLLPFLYY